MKILWTAAAAALTLGLVSVASAHASSIAVQNSSFETLPATWATDATPCGGSCAYSSGSIPDWSTTGATGQWIVGGYAGNPSATDGDVLAYSNGGSIYQTVGTAVAGTTYTLQVDVLHRTDLPLEGVVELEVGSVIVATAPVVDGGAGTWSDWTAAFTATAADVGRPGRFRQCAAVRAGRARVGLVGVAVDRLRRRRRRDVARASQDHGRASSGIAGATPRRNARAGSGGLPSIFGAPRHL